MLYHATEIKIIKLNALKRVSTPNISKNGKINSDPIATCQLISAGIRLNGKGKRSCISANQFCPFHFSNPDSKNSHARKSVKSINLRHCRYLASYNPSFFYLSNFLAFKAKSVLSYLSYHTRKYYPVAYLVEDKPFSYKFFENFNYQQKSGNMRTNF